MKIVTEPPVLHSERLLTSHEVGDLLQMNPSSINKWVKEGRIVAFRTPGGHRRIRAGDLVDFLTMHKMPIPKLLAPATRRRLLVVDDDAKQLRAIQRWVKPYEPQVELAVSEHGIDALVQVGSFRPHLILLDIFMPELDGVEVCRRLQANPETRHILVIATSGQFTRALEESVLSAGAQRCLPKPIQFRVVLEELGVPLQLSG